jgi:hypothetical protein
MGEEQKSPESGVRIDDTQLICLNRKQIDTINAVFESEKVCRRALTLAQMSSPKIGCQDIVTVSANIWTGKIAKIVYFSLGVIIGGFAGFGISKAL